ncbi:MAG: sulfate adenylyltransferase, partial [Gammaproteobacteria bacterium]|nr:sulfate adenylyltransferase [Gammaproteobacteria bacterium]
MIKPHGSDTLKALLVTDAAEHRALSAEAEKLPSLLLNSAAAANVVMLGGGYFNPLRGFMDLSDALAVAKTMHTADGLFWPVPVLNLTNDIAAIEGASRIALRDPNVSGHPVIAIMKVDKIEPVTDKQIETMTRQVYGTVDTAHPGVAVFTQLGKYCVSGKIKVLNLSYFEKDFPETFRTAVQIRQEIEERGWSKVVAFQTRNPMHLAHEELCRMAMERLGADGLVIHMLLGKLKEGDIPASVRDACIRKMVDVYFAEGSAMVNGYGFDMLYAGPREAVLHAVFRQNMGATHLIVGRDHAGVGSYYGPFDAQAIFETVPEGSLEIQIFAAD